MSEIHVSALQSENATTTVVVGDTRVVVPAPTKPHHILLGKLGFWAQVGFMLAYIGVLSGAMFYFQFGLNEFPCPLCITQRMGMMLSSLGALYVIVNSLRGRLSPSGFMTGLGFAIMGALLGAVMSIRQILLHIMPGDPGYGGAVLGLHLYTWALVSFVVVLIFAGVLLTFGTEFLPVRPSSKFGRVVAWIVIGIFLFTVVANMVVVFAEEGFNMYLPDDPTSWVLFQQLGWSK
ncbi:MAG: disulfide bond formation protein B [Actinomycetales bacterium]|nr:disulfide bond formation protein B [Actinomycetales bacterium]